VGRSEGGAISLRLFATLTGGNRWDGGHKNFSSAGCCLIIFYLLVRYDHILMPKLHPLFALLFPGCEVYELHVPRLYGCCLCLTAIIVVRSVAFSCAAFSAYRLVVVPARVPEGPVTGLIPTTPIASGHYAFLFGFVVKYLRTLAFHPVAVLKLTRESAETSFFVICPPLMNSKICLFLET